MADFKKVDAAALNSRAKSLFVYDPQRGALINLATRGNSKSGEVAGSVNKTNGYREMMVDRAAYRAHRLIWLFHNGEWPSANLDHINGDRDDNRIENLRIATAVQNNVNRRPKGKLGLKGVSRRPSGRFAAFISEGGKSRQIGLYDTPEEAHQAYCGEAERIHGDFAYHQSARRVRDGGKV